MNSSYWCKQQRNLALFSELEWNKPERRDQAGRLLIVGGNIHSLNAPLKSYEQAKRCGIGNVKVALPDRAKRLLEKNVSEVLFLPATSGGEFAQKALEQLEEYSQWADTLLLPGDIGRNSQTTILCESLLKSVNNQIILTKDSVDIISNNPNVLLSRENTTLIVSFAQLQKLVKNSGQLQSITYTIDLLKLVEFLHILTLEKPISIVTLHNNQLLVAVGGKVSTTKLSQTDEPKHWRLQTATVAACYQTWNPESPFESLTHTAYLLTKV